MLRGLDLLKFDQCYFKQPEVCAIKANESNMTTFTLDTTSKVAALRPAAPVRPFGLPYMFSFRKNFLMGNKLPTNYL